MGQCPLCKCLAGSGILANAVAPPIVRLVTHYQITDHMDLCWQVYNAILTGLTRSSLHSLPVCRFPHHRAGLSGGILQLERRASTALVLLYLQAFRRRTVLPLQAKTCPLKVSLSQWSYVQKNPPVESGDPVGVKFSCAGLAASCCGTYFHPRVIAPRRLPSFPEPRGEWRPVSLVRKDSHRLASMFLPPQGTDGAVSPMLATALGGRKAEADKVPLL